MTRKANLDPDVEKRLWDFIPYTYAASEWRALRVGRGGGNARLADAQHGPLDVMGCCKFCGFPIGRRGFVRLPFPIGHRLFGRAICCPECWPPPFGRARRGTLSGEVAEIAEAWENILDGLDK